MADLDLNEIKEMKMNERESGEIFWFGETRMKGCKVIEIPVYIGRIKVWLETHVVEGDVPWIIGSQMLERSGANIDVSKGCMTVEGECVSLRRNKVGHIMVTLRKKRVTREIWLNGNMMSCEDSEVWKKNCVKLHVQMGHASFKGLKEIVCSALEGCDVFRKNKTDRLQGVRRGLQEM